MTTLRAAKQDLEILTQKIFSIKINNMSTFRYIEM